MYRVAIIMHQPDPPGRSRNSCGGEGAGSGLIMPRTNDALSYNEAASYGK